MPQPKKTGREMRNCSTSSRLISSRFYCSKSFGIYHSTIDLSTGLFFILIISSSFLIAFQSTHPFLINIVFDTISSIILADNANYFLCGENLSPLTENLYSKSHDVQTKIYDLMEFIVFQLKFIPHRELVNLSILLKSER